MIFRPHRFLTKPDEYGDNDVSLLSLPKKRHVQNHPDSMVKTIVFRIYCCYKTTYKYTCVKWVTTLFWSPKFRYSSGEMILAFIWIWYPLITSMGASIKNASFWLASYWWWWKRHNLSNFTRQKERFYEMSFMLWFHKLLKVLQ